MGRPRLHDEDVLLDAAVTLFATGGARAVTMSAVARAAGAPSGSVYHRFADRPALLSSLWLRTVRRFQRGWLAAVDREPHVDGAVAGARYTVDWCRDNLEQAVVLYAGKRALDPAGWSATARTEVATNEAELDDAIETMVKGLATGSNLPPEVVALAVVDMPYAVVRRYLVRGEPPPEPATELVDTAVRKLLCR